MACSVLNPGLTDFRTISNSTSVVFLLSASSFALIARRNSSLQLIRDSLILFFNSFGTLTVISDSFIVYTASTQTYKDSRKEPRPSERLEGCGNGHFFLAAALLRTVYERRRPRF